MTHQRNIENLLDLWLGEGSSVAPDRVIDVVADRIERQPQRGAWRFPTWEIPMPAYLRLAAVAAALALLGAGAIYFAGSPRPTVSPPNPGPSPTLIPSTSPSPSPYVLPSTVPDQTAQTLSWTSRPGLRINLPAGWKVKSAAQTLDPLYLSLLFGSDSHPGGGVTIRANPVLGGDPDPCASAVTDVGTGRSVTAIVAALLADPRLTTTPGPAFTLDGTPAQILDIALSPSFKSFVADTCAPGKEPMATLFGGPGSIIALAGDRRVRVILTEVEGVPVLVFVMPEEESFDAFAERVMSVLESATFLP